MSLTMAVQTSEYPLTPNDLPMPPVAFGLIALALFAVGLLVLWFFRGTAQKVSGPIDTHGENLPGTHADIGHDTHTAGEVTR
jgi:hypothetical protein